MTMAEAATQSSGTAAKKTARPAASSAILMISLEMLAVGLFTLLAGASDEAGRIVVLMMVTFWVIFVVTESSVVAAFGNALASLVGNPSNS